MSRAAHFVGTIAIILCSGLRIGEIPVPPVKIPTSSQVK